MFIDSPEILPIEGSIRASEFIYADDLGSDTAFMHDSRFAVEVGRAGVKCILNTRHNERQ